MSQKKKILYIEDDEANRELVGFILAQKNHLVMLEAETGQQGLERAASERVDLIILDISLPDINGDEVLRRLKSNPETANIPVIALTGGPAPKLISESDQQGFTDYLSKPVNLERLHQALENALVDRDSSLLRSGD